MMKKMLIAALLACAFAPAMADEMAAGETAAADAPRVERRIVTRTAGDDLHLRLADRLDFANAMGGATTVMHVGKNIKNAPYSADIVSERIQMLGDGNQIVKKSESKSYRDSAGRTRTEVRNEAGDVLTVVIHDPVEGSRYVLRPRDKTAIKAWASKAPVAGATREQARAAAAEARVAAAHARASSNQVRARIEELRKEGKLPDGVRERVIVKQVERAGGQAGEHQDVRIRVEQLAEAHAAAAARVAPMVAGALGDRKWASKADTKDLGTREFNGVKAAGTQRSYEIPAGEIGNRNAIVVSTETWTSPELQAVVYRKHVDPRVGESIFRLEGLKREEPAAALFTVPSDYTVKDPMETVRATVEKLAADRARQKGQ
jgi:hypothetical protein